MTLAHLLFQGFKSAPVLGEKGLRRQKQAPTSQSQMIAQLLDKILVCIGVSYQSVVDNLARLRFGSSYLFGNFVGW